MSHAYDPKSDAYMLARMSFEVARDVLANIARSEPERLRGLADFFGLDDVDLHVIGQLVDRIRKRKTR